ncbi:MAG TPA: hypothetical protein VNI34_00475 [Candidatus Nitrosotalea sp.]|nr:hypothetical protein [Candidatus Nitrosotalea sp.]
MTAPHRTRRALVGWWEHLSVAQNLALGFALLGPATFALNLALFNLSWLRSLAYGVFEGGILAGLLAVATQTERGRRR